ncbi:MAG: CDP-alcohol phosphatidyltransferase family protein [Erysipelotrichaceae bacterium]|nr:CDP-alcohol phosphatidyltransferase family protein [Erysipelotrichaceae bacterium]
MLKKNLANIITITRIVATAAFLFLKVLTRPFYLVYVWCGLSDVLDGFVARSLKITSSFGSKLDTVSDLFFYSAMLYKIWPYLHNNNPAYIPVLINVIIFYRIILYIAGGFIKKTLVSRHTYINKATGLIMFFLPFLVESPYLTPYCLFNLALGYAASINESVYIFRKEKKNEDSDH